MNEVETKLDELLNEIRGLKREAGLPTVLTKRRAAKELSIGLTKLEQLIAGGQIATCDVGDRKMVPASEIARLATPKALSPKSRPSPPKRGPGRPKGSKSKAAKAQSKAQLRSYLDSLSDD